MKLSLAIAVLPGALAATQAPRSKQFPQESIEQFNPLRYTGTTGPYMPARGFGIDSEVPDYCKVTQAHLFMRHGERYPTKGTGKGEKTVYQKLKNATEEMAYIEGPLAFMKDYTFFVEDDSRLETESNAGYYAGLTTAFELGSTLRERYDDLFDENTIHPVFAGGQARVVESAKAFGKGFFGANYTDLCSIQVIPEEPEQGANTLTTHDACNNYNGSLNSDYYYAFAENTKYLEKAAARLNNASPGFNLTGDDVYTLMGYCGFELNVRGYSEVCDLFTMEEWLHFDYSKSLEYYYQNGPGGELSAALGSIYANNTYTIMKQGEDYPYNLTFSFSHDSDLFTFGAALGLYEPDYDMTNEYVDFDTTYKAGHLAPMGGRFITERLECMDILTNKTDVYARVIANDVVVPIPGCQNGPGFSCPLDGYWEVVEERLQNTTYVQACGVNSTVPQYNTFYWDWNVTFDDN